ncbi:MAG: SIS domain-containing protein [Herbinix sp.]|nr:SIS domain-containing protein [Herbinix sp.]
MNFLTDEYLDTYVKKMEKVVALRHQIEKIVDEVMQTKKSNLFLLGVGGTIAILRPYLHMFKTMSNIEVYGENAAEFNLTGNPKLTKDSVVFIMSDSGNTKEIKDSIQLIKKIGATTIAGVGTKGAPIGEMVDYCVYYTDKDTFSADADYLVQHMFFTYLLYKRGEFPNYEKFVSNLEVMPQALAQVKVKADIQGQDFAKKYHKESYHIFTGAGNTWGETYCYSMCVLEEMQWIRAKSVHGADFFHGTLELVEEDVPVVIIKGEDESRVLMDRIEAFSKQYSKKVTVYDSKDYELKGIDEEFRSLLAPIVICAALGRINPYMEYATGHNLSFRRYYKVVEY